MAKESLRPQLQPQQEFTLATLSAEKRALLESWGVRDFPVLHPREESGDSDELPFLPPEKLQELFHHESLVL